MTRMTAIAALLALVLGSVPWRSTAQADVLELRDGQRLEGIFRGADTSAIQFDVEEQVHLIPLDQVRSLIFVESTDRAQTPPLEPSTRVNHPRPAEASAPPLPRPAPQHPLLETARVETTRTAAQATATPRSAATADSPRRPRKLEIPTGTLLRVRISDSVDPRFSAKGDRFAGLLETEFTAGGKPVIPAKTRVYGVVSEARTKGPIASRLKLELSALMLSGEMLRVVSGTHKVVTPDGAGPAKAASSRSDRLPAGTVLEFRLLQSAELTLRH